MMRCLRFGCYEDMVSGGAVALLYDPHSNGLFSKGPSGTSGPRPLIFSQHAQSYTLQLNIHFESSINPPESAP